MKNQLLRSLLLSGVFLSSAISLQAYQINPFPTGSCTSQCEPCGECDGALAEDATDSENSSVLLRLNVGRAALERPTNFASFYGATVANGDDPHMPQGFSSIRSYFNKFPMKNLWGASLTLKTADITADSFKPSSLTYNHALKMTVLTDSNDVIRQVLTHDFLVDLQALASPEEGFEANWYFAEDKGNLVGGFYQPTEDAVKTVIVSNPDAGTGAYEKLDVSLEQEMPNSSQRKTYTRYHFTTSLEGKRVHTMETWTKKPEESGAVQIAEDSIEYLLGAPINGEAQLAMDRIRTLKTADYSPANGWGSLSLVGRTREVYSDIDGKSRMTKSIRLDSETDDESGLATTYGYFGSSNTLTHGLPKWQKSYDGSWVVWQVTANETTQTITKITPFKDGSFVLADDGSNVASVIPSEARVEIQTISATSMDTVVKVQDVKVARIYENFRTGSAGERVMDKKSYYYMEPTGDSAYYYPEYKAFYPYGDGSATEAGRLAWQAHLDGSVTVYEYEEVSGGFMKVTQSTGAADGSSVASAPTITSGTKIVTEYNKFWEPISEEKTDIATSISLDYWISDGNEDLYGRWTSRSFNGDINDKETRTFGCCGLIESRSRYGATTSSSYDLLKRVYSTSKKKSSTDTSIKTETTFSGLVRTSSVSAGGILFDSSKTEVNLLGQVIESWSADADGDGALELTTISTEYPSGGGKKVTRSNSESGTTISQTYRDGQLKSSSGTAVVGKIYDYGSYSGGPDGEASRGSGMWSKVTAANQTEWTTTYYDELGRVIQSSYPDNSYSSRSYNNIRAVDGARGRIYKIQDADETATAGTGTSIVYAYGYNEANQFYRTVTEQLPDSQTRVTTTTSGVVPSVTETVDDGNGGSSEETTHGVTIKGVLIHPALFQKTEVNSVETGTTYRSADGYLSGSVSFGNGTLTQRSTPTAATDGDWTVTSISADGQTTLQTYTQGLLEKTEIFDNQGTAAANLVTSTSYTYDDLNRTATVTDARTGAVTYSGATGTGYTPSGNLLGMKDAGGRLAKYSYDSLGRRLTTTLPDDSVVHTSYTPRSEVRATWGSQTYPRFYVYDSQGRMSELHTWQSEPTLEQTTDTPPSGSAKTEWLYHDERGWLVEKNFAGESDTQTSDPDYTYTSAGRLQKRDWERGVDTTYSYQNGHLTGVDYSDSATDLVYTYDDFGRLETVTQGGNTHDYNYDGATLLLDTETVTYDLDNDGNIDLTRVLDRSFDNQRRPDGWELKDVNVENAVSYGYDDAGRLQYLDPSFPLPTDPTTSAFSYTYEGNSYSLLETLSGPAHTVDNTWENDRNVLLNKVNHTGIQTSPVSKYDYAVTGAVTDGANDIGQRKNLLTSGSAFDLAFTDPTATGPAYGWTYNSRGELTAADDTSSAGDDRAYQYDAIGNREKAADSLTLPSTPNYVANALNQYATANNVLLPTTPYDDDGNFIDGPLPVEAGNATLVWDAENRLVEVTPVSGSAIQYQYDYLGRRISKQIGSGTVEFYLYDGWNLIAEYTGGSLSKSYAWGVDLSGSIQGAGGVGGLLAVDDTTATYYPTYDGNGNVSEYLNASGGIEAHYEYDAFGNTTTSGGTKSGDFRHRFSTKPLDAETGLYYYGYRYYDPVTGRWPSRDPIEEGGGLNLYGFVSNGGLNHVDSLGLVESDSKWVVSRVKYTEERLPEGDDVYTPFFLQGKHKFGWSGSGAVDYYARPNEVVWGVWARSKIDATKHIQGYTAEVYREYNFECDPDTGIWSKGETLDYNPVTISGWVYADDTTIYKTVHRNKKVTYLTIDTTVKVGFDTSAVVGLSFGVSAGVGNLARYEKEYKFSKTFKCVCVSGSGNDGGFDDEDDE